MQIFARVLQGGASNDNGVVDDDFLGYFGGYFFGNFREKVCIIYNLLIKTNKKAVLWQENRTMPL